MKAILIIWLALFTNSIVYGQIDFLNCYEVNGSDSPRDIIINKNGAFVITGQTSNETIFLIIDSLGNQIVNSEIDIGPHGSSGWSIIESIDSNEIKYFIMGIQSHHGLNFDYKPFLVELDSLGNKIWEKSFGVYPELGPLAIPRKMVKDAEYVYLANLDTLVKVNMISKDEMAITTGEICGINLNVELMQIAGQKVYFLCYDSGYKLLITDLEFNFIELVEITSNLDFIYQMKVIEENAVLMSGSDGWKWKLASLVLNDYTEWEMEYNLDNYSVGYPYTMQVLPDGYLMAGSMAKLNPSGWCPMTVKVDKLGNIKWYKQIGECNTNNGILAMPKKSLVVTGRRRCLGAGQDVFVSRVDTTIVDYVVGTKEVEKKKRISVFPNPVCDYIEIEDCFDCSYRVIDMSGRVFAAEILQSNKIQLENLVNGIYILQVLGTKGELQSNRFVKNCYAP